MTMGGDAAALQASVWTLRAGASTLMMSDGARALEAESFLSDTRVPAVSTAEAKGDTAAR